MPPAAFRICGTFAVALLLPACSIGGSGTLTPTTAPGIPSEVVAVGGNGRVTLTWRSPGAAATFTVSRSSTSGGPYLPISLPAQFPTPTSYQDVGLDNGTPYFYTVTASNRYGTSPPSIEVTGTPRFAAVAVAQGSVTNHTLALFEDGTVWGWGLNNDGEVGNGVQNYQSSPALGLGLPRVTALARGAGFSMALENNGTVWTWGRNALGQLGRSTPGGASALTPDRVPGLTNIIAVSAGYTHALALTSDGTVLSWGDNAYGELGKNTSGLPDPVPSLVGTLSGITAIAAGAHFSLALMDDGTVWAWGINQAGSLGNGGTVSPIDVPGQVKNLTGVTQIAAGTGHGLALRDDGTVWAWGDDGRGQVGNGVFALNVPTAAQVVNLRDVVSIAAGSSHSLAVKGDGSVWAWGDNYNFGALGNGSQTGIVNSPAPVLNLAGMTKVAGGYYHSVAIKSDGTVWTWGGNGEGELGIGAGNQNSVAKNVTNLTQATALSAGGSHALALRSDATAWAWGGNQQGQLGRGSTFNSTSLPGQVSVLTNVTATAGGAAHSMALKSDGTVWTWGSNATGQIGNGTTSATPLSTPFQVPVAATVFTAVSAGANHSLALKNDGTVLAWGSNVAGQLGNGSTSAVPVTSPGAVLLLTGIKAIAAGTQHNLALRNDGTVWAWGSNSSGQLGLGFVSGTPLTTPQQVLTGIGSIAAGETHSMAVATNGTVWTWGSNGNGEIGTNFAGGPVPTPYHNPSLSGISAVAAGSGFSVALQSDGTVWSWGANANSELGDGTIVPHATPAPIAGLSGITAVSSSGHYTLALANNGLSWAWGLNISEQLGVPFVQYSSVPVVIAH